jgi:hypothetical protein
MTTTVVSAAGAGWSTALAVAHQQQAVAACAVRAQVNRPVDVAGVEKPLAVDANQPVALQGEVRLAALYLDELASRVRGAGRVDKCFGDAHLRCRAERQASRQNDTRYASHFGSLQVQNTPSEFKCVLRNRFLNTTLNRCKVLSACKETSHA